LRIQGINEEQRDAVIREVYEQGVAVNVHFIPLPMLSFYKSRGYNIAGFPQAYDFFASEISLPVYYGLTKDQLKYIAHTVMNSVRKVMAG
jgi:dTDP-4-amino-4,6-dideoxygalactose transaminase